MKSNHFRPLCLVWPTLLFSFLLTSCMAYQHVTINSHLPFSSQEGFCRENDSIRLVYSFAGTNCPLTIDVFNKTSGPLFIDWGKSAVVFEDQSYVLAPGETPFSGFVSTTLGYSESSGEYAQADFTGVVVRSAQVSFVPPASRIRVTPMNLVNEFLPVEPTKPRKKGNMYTSNGPVRLKYTEYDVASSPLYFKSFITYSNRADIANPCYLSDEFWASRICKSNSLPTVVGPNQYHAEKVSGFGMTASVIGLVFLTVGYVATYAVTTPVE